MADQAFPHGDFAALAKIGVLVGSILAAVLGALVLVSGEAAVTPAKSPA
jgi:Na+/H+ antiporter NhaA